MTSLPHVPPYGHGTLAEVMPSAAAALGMPGVADSLGLREHLAEPHGVTVLLVDGLGWGALEAHAEIAPSLASLAGGPLHATFPTTTPTSLASLGTGMAPGEHGIVGAAFFLPDSGHVLHPLTWRDEPHPLAVQPEPTLLERAERHGLAVSSVSPRPYEHSGLTRAALRGGDYRGADSFGERVAEVAAAAQKRPSLTYAYWADLDRTGHVHGVRSEAWREELRNVDHLVGRILDVLPEDHLLVVTADHGMIDCEKRINIDADPRFRHGTRFIAGEPRMRHVYARTGAANDVADAWRAALGDAAWVLTRDEATAAGLFGEVIGDHDERIGDVLALARDDVALVSDQVDRAVSSLLGQHGSLTEEDLMIPLLAARGGSDRG